MSLVLCLLLIASMALLENIAATMPQYKWPSISLFTLFQYTRNVRIQQLSPFEVDLIGPLFKNQIEKIKHKVEDNFWDVAPPVIFFVCLIAYVKQQRKEVLLHHRD